MDSRNVITPKMALIYLDESNTTYFDNSKEGREVMLHDLTLMDMTDEIDAILEIWGDSPLVVPTLDDLKAEKRLEIAAARYEYEIAGVVYNNVRVTTDREDQSMITAVALSAVVDPTYTTVWKGADGYLDLDATSVLMLARMVGAHVEAAFAEEKRLVEQIDAAQDEAELASIVWTLN